MDDQTPKLFPKAIDAQRDTLALKDCGQISYYSDTAPPGIPLLLLHSINAAPSAMEMQPLFHTYKGTRPVYALDLPGFGASQRQDREYSSVFFARTIDRFVRDVIGQECDVVALSLSCEFVARASLEHQTPFRSVCMISPTGFTEKEMPGARSGEKITKFLRLPLVGSTLFRLLTTKPSIRYFLGLSFNGKPPAELVNYAAMTTNHPAARFAPFSFLGGKLFDNNATQNLYLKLTVPVQVLYDKDPNISFEKLPNVAKQRKNWRLARLIDTHGMPHWTHTEETTSAMNSFWAEIASQ